MAAKKNKTQQTEKVPTQLTKIKDHFREEVNKRIQLGEEILQNLIQTSYSSLEENKQRYYDWDDYNSELLKQSFNNEHNEYKNNYDNLSYSSVYSLTLWIDESIDELKELKERLQKKITNLKQLVSKIDLMKSEIPNQTVSEEVAEKTEHKLNENIFIVHGHNNEIKNNVARTLEKLDLKPIILHEQANAGKTIIEKFEEHSNVGFAIILLTDDDLGKAKNDTELNQRARQNVLFELGYFIGKLGRKQVCPLYSKGVELPTDISGVSYIEIDQGDNWKIKMSQELKAAGYKIDLNKLI